LWAQCQPAAPGPVGLIEVPVGVEDLIDAAPDEFDERGVVLSGLAHQTGLHLGTIGLGHTRGQHVDGPADDAQMILTDRAGFHRLGQHRLRRW
jgi:hypothetical protein